MKTNKKIKEWLDTLDSRQVKTLVSILLQMHEQKHIDTKIEEREISYSK